MEPAAAEAASQQSEPAGQAAERMNGDEVTVIMGESERHPREYRVRGLSKNQSFDVLRINLRLMCHELFYINVIDLYQARQRAGFIDEAARETLLERELIKRDLGKLLLELERIQDERIRAAAKPSGPAAPEMSEAERAEALALLRDPRLLERIVEDFERCGIVGETNNKLVGYLAGVSRKLENPLAVIIQSTSAAGKSSLMEAILNFMPEEERLKYSAMTGQSLYYLGDKDLKHKILAIVEEEGAERASYALKLLQSERELVIASTGKDPQSGRMVTQEYRVEGPVMILITTTAIDIDEELLNRCLILTVDESREQTRRIHELQREKRTIQGHERKLQKEAIVRRHRNAQRLLQPLPVINLWAKHLTFLDDKTRTRRDHEKYLTLIDAIAFLRQHQRETVKDSRGVECVPVTLDDIADANRLASEALGRCLDELPPQTRRLLTHIHEMVTAASRRLKVTRSDYRFTRREVREYTGWSNTPLKVHMQRLEELEYLLVRRGVRSGDDRPGHGAGRQGQTLVYELLYDGEGCAGAKFLMGLLDVESMRAQMSLSLFELSDPRDGFQYDGNLSGVNEEKSGQSPAQVRGVSGESLGAENTTNACMDAGSEPIEPQTVEKTHTGGGANGAS